MRRSFPLRQVIGDATVHGSSGIELARDHPSRNAQPSDGLPRTQRLATAAEALEHIVLDSLVLAGTERTSLR